MLELYNEADSKGGSGRPLPAGLLPKAKVEEEECLRLAKLRQNLRDRLRIECCKGGGPDVIPDTELHPLARSARKPAQSSGFWTRRGQRTAPDSCNAGQECPVFKRHATQDGLDSEAFLRAMLSEGPFTPMPA